jgi:subtilisin family serine protease
MTRRCVLRASRFPARPVVAIVIGTLTLLAAGIVVQRGRHRPDRVASPHAAAGPPAPSAALRDATRQPFRPEVVLFAFRQGVSPGQRRAVERSVGGRGASRLGPAGPTGSGPGEGRVHPAPLLMRVPKGNVVDVVRRLRRRRQIAYAEPDYLMQASTLPNDAGFAMQWADSNTGQPIPSEDAFEVVGPPTKGRRGAAERTSQAWDASTGSRSIVIGEADTGIDYNHPDLAANVWSNPGGIGGCAPGTHGFDVLTGSCEPMDDDTTYGGHGTHVAGILGAVGNNRIGIAGVNWQTSILAVKWLDSSAGGSTSGLIAALQWLLMARQAGVNLRVVNDSATFVGTPFSQALSDEIDTLGANNILFVTAAGNTGDDNDQPAVRRYPCGYQRPTEICVTASDNSDRLPSWANYGSHTVDLAAPGVSIYSTLRNGAYGFLSGGSTAAPQVAGAAALILSVEPSLSATALKAHILKGVDRLPSLSGRVATAGRLDICKALPACPVAVLSRLEITPTAFHPKGGATVSYRDAKPALISAVVLAPRRGVKISGHGCVVLPRQKRRVGRPCTRYLALASFTHRDRAGRNSLHISDRIGGRRLSAGTYRIQLTPAFVTHPSGPGVTFQIFG